ncbi:MAG: thioredoxin domain-containing protein [Candidatus Brocadiales bacterium]
MTSPILFLLILLSIALLPTWRGSPRLCAEEQGGPAAAHQKENRLAKSASPYLRSARFQPIDWHEYGKEAFALAKRLDRPILLDIGAVWCHWCHVMDEETYEDPEVAELINKYFVAVKVDMDERPDIDRWYQTAVSALTGHGGWPLTAFLTPDGKVFFGGTYFPAESKWGREGLKSLLPKIAKVYKEQTEELQAQAEQHYQYVLGMESTGLKAGELSSGLLDAIAKGIAEDFDRDFGGFGTGAKFPSEAGIEFALWRAFVKKDAEPLTGDLALKTLDATAEGGIRDHIRGGFFRYAVDREWRVPHFEKMPYVNSGMLRNFVHAYAATGSGVYKGVVEEIVDYITREASDSELGGFYASQDADVGRGDDGDYYTWTPAEVDAVLTPLEAKAIKYYYEIEAQGEMHHNPAKNVPRISVTLEEVAKELNVTVEEVSSVLSNGRKKLLESRNASPTPFVDRNKYSSWNGMMISAYLEVYKFLGRDDIRDFALKGLDLLLANSYEMGKGVFRTYYEGEARIPGYLDDNIWMSLACLDAYEVSGERRYLEATEDIINYCLENFWDDEQGGFFDTAHAQRVFVRKPFEDTPTPAANAVAAMVLDRLYYITYKDEYREGAERTLKAYAASAKESGHFASAYALALAYHINIPPHAVIIGKKDAPDTLRLLMAALGTYRPGKIVTVHDPTEEAQLPYPASADGKAVAYVCVPLGYCAPPTREEAKVVELLKTLGIE